MFNPGASTGRLRASSLLRGWGALLGGEVFVLAPDGTRGWTVLFGRRMT